MKVEKILLIGQCSLHIGRMEFGNIGNYYIIEPFIRELHRCFPGVHIRTTLQMSDDFCQKEKVTCLPIELYYGWSNNDTANVMMELGVADVYNKTGKLSHITPYIEEVMAADLVIDFSGDIWGDNADFLGSNRFLVGLCKDRIAQLLGKKIVMLAGSPGPFGNEATKRLAQEVFADFDLVTNRESVSRALLERDGFRTDHLVDLACPAFLFEPASGVAVEQLLDQIGLNYRDKLLVGFVLCGWNFTEGPFDKWPREDSDYVQFAEAIEHLVIDLGARVYLMSHANGFVTPAPPFTLIHGRDYPIIKQLQSLIEKRGLAKDVFTLDGIYSAWETKAIVSCFDMLVSGRAHAAVAGLSQYVPTTIIDYGHEPKAHKLKGFAAVAGVGHLVADPAKPNDLTKKIDCCWQDRIKIQSDLKEKIPEVQAIARHNFDLLKSLVNE